MDARLVNGGRIRRAAVEDPAGIFSARHTALLLPLMAGMCPPGAERKPVHR
jgi:hypothetical protein